MEHQKSPHQPRRAAAACVTAGLVALWLSIQFCLQAAASASGDPLPRVRSAVQVTGCPAPIIPLCEPVDDSYFGDVILLGDSLASSLRLYKAMPAIHIISKSGLLLSDVAKNKGAFRSRGGVDNRVPVTRYLASFRPRVVYIWLGLNSIKNKSPQDALVDYHLMMNRMIDTMPNTLFCLLEMMPTAEWAADRLKGRVSNEKVNEFNQGLMELAKEHNVYVLQIHDILLDEDGMLAEPYAQKDNYHLTSLGCSVVVSYLYTHALPLDRIVLPEDQN